MTPAEKAEQIFEQMFFFTPMQSTVEQMNLTAKYCSIQAVKEIILALQLPTIENKGHKLYDATIDYWNEVKSILRSR